VGAIVGFSQSDPYGRIDLAEVDPVLHPMIALQVESPNTGAIALYRRCGFTEWDRRRFVPFPGSM